MRILMTGGTGLIGRALSEALRQRGDVVEVLSRRAGPSEHGVTQWDPMARTLDPAVVSDFDAVVHLAGENIGSGYWTASKKARIEQSRLNGTSMLSRAVAQARPKPRVFVSTSAIGYYGNRGAEVLVEDSGPGSGFLADVVAAWEEAAAPAREAGIRVVTPRTGPVLSARGGMLPKMLLPFKLGLGGVVGSGNQYMSWIALADLIQAFVHLIDHEDAGAGPVNVVAPNPATNRDFTRALGRALQRPTVLPLPSVVARLVLGEMAEELLLVSQRVSVDRLVATGFQFEYPGLEGALEHILDGD